MAANRQWSDLSQRTRGLLITAADVLNTYSAGDLTRVLREYGEEKFASRIAGAVVRRRETTPWTTSGPLVELLYEVIPAPAGIKPGFYYLAVSHAENFGENNNRNRRWRHPSCQLRKCGGRERPSGESVVGTSVILR